MILLGVLSRYIAKRYLFSFTMNLIAISALIFVVDFGETARRFSNVAGYSADIAAFLSLLRIPVLIQISIPFMVLIATISTLLNLSKKYELVIARASGLSAWQFLLPIIVCNLVIGALSITTLNPLGAYTARLADEIATSNGFGDTFSSGQENPPWLRQTTSEGTTIIGARSQTDNGQLLNQVTFLRLDADDIISDRVEAKQARLSDGYWQLNDVSIIKNGEAAKKTAILKIKTNLQPEFIEEAFSSADSVSFFDLPTKIDAANSFGLKASSYITKFHQLLALPAFLVAMTFIAGMVSLTFVRFGQSLYAIMGGILAGFLLYVLSELISAFGEAGAIPPIVAAWIPVIIASTIGGTVLLHKEDG
ncbi:LPS export ABC transporter permease LptG [Lentilitoribacter sp. Alg239-R112]|uniref:LPS export ABC transporter permease LptG n=1 Tax=Lentilitoribacter sp. Alg239-R112 TaxID=2305987 RepID=UPI0013A6C9C1|nr:LPS export ABC transporter permease LptG [Lentilitoribacter sp. Alg239-R112]